LKKIIKRKKTNKQTKLDGAFNKAHNYKTYKKNLGKGKDSGIGI